MSDTLYLSLWYPNLRVDALPEKLAQVLSAFAACGGGPRVYAATVWPVSWNETAVYQCVWGRGDRGAEPRAAVAQALDPLHDDFAYEFQIEWQLWNLDAASAEPRWVREPRLVRVVGFGPLFDEGAYETEGHIKIDFGSDAPFLEEEADLGLAAGKIEENVRQLIALANAGEKESGATARLLWSELGESLAARLAARLATKSGAGN